MEINKKYLLGGFLLVMLGIAIVAAIASTPIVEEYVAYGVENKLYGQFNEDRHLYGADELMWDGKLANVAYNRSIQIVEDASQFKNVDAIIGDTHEDIFVISTQEFERSYYISPVWTVDTWRNIDMQFKSNELDPDHTNVGIGVSRFNGYYYIVILWR